MVLDRLARIEGILNDQTARLSQIQIRDNRSPNHSSTSPYSAIEPFPMPHLLQNLLFLSFVRNYLL